jgi:hypothetical protein
MHYIHIKFSCLAYTRSHKFNIYLQHQIIHQKISASRRKERHWTTLGGLVPPSPDILGALALIGRRRHHHLVFLLASSSTFFQASSFLLALIYRDSATLSFFTYWSSFLTKANLFSNFWIWKWIDIFSNYTKQLKSRSSSYELTSLMWGHSSL